MPSTRIVVDTRVLVSRLLLANSLPAQAVRKAIENGRLLVSDAAMMELANVPGRSNFDAYISLADRQQFIRLLGRFAEFVTILRPIRACRDPNDDTFLEVAVNGEADLVVSGDQDLLAMHPFMSIPILSPADYLNSVGD